MVDEEATGVGAFGFNPRVKYLELKNAGRPGPPLVSMPNPVVFWCPDCRYTVYLNIAPANALNWAPASYTVNKDSSFIMQQVRMVGATPNTITRPLVWATKLCLPPEIVLFHELGHIRQYLTDKAHYVSWLTTHNIPALEADNLAKHEWPICAEFGYGKRANYHEDQDFLANLPGETYFRCAEPTSRAVLDQKIRANSSPLTLRGRQVTKVNYFTEYRVSPASA